MRVAIIAPEYPPEVGGMQTYAYEFTKTLIKKGYSVEVFTKKITDSDDIIDNEKIIVHRTLTLRRKFDSPLLESYDFDVWHVMNASYSWICKIKENVIVSVHGNDFLRPYLLIERLDLQKIPSLWRFNRVLSKIDKYIGQLRTNYTVKRCLPKVKHIISNSEYTAEKLFEKYPDCKPITTVAYVGVSDLFLKEPLKGKKNTKKINFLTVCRLSEVRKNVAKVISALAQLKKSNFHYFVIGDGRLKSELEALVKKSGLSGKVTFLGQTDSKTLRQHMTQADLFILVSSIEENSHEGFGIVYLEANACGTPVLAAKLAGAIEAVDEGKSGYFVKGTDVNSIKLSLGEFISGKHKFDVEQCRQFSEKFSWERVVKHAISYY